jgi:hypothetical protein
MTDSVNIELPLRAFQARVDIMEQVIRLLVGSLAQPRMRRINSDRGYRFDEPTTHHFCLLKAVRVVSALNASIELARRGYTQEIAVLMRTVAEFTTHIEFVLDMDDSAEHELKVKNYIEAFFADSRRDPEAELKKAQVPQGIVHTSIGRTLDKLMAEQAGSVEGRTPAASLYSNVYRIYSNYVHGKYPEIMDLYGGTPGRFHLHGMSGTPKDSESVAALEAFVTSASNTFIRIVQCLNLRDRVAADPVLDVWYKEGVSGCD